MGWAAAVPSSQRGTIPSRACSSRGPVSEKIELCTVIDVDLGEATLHAGRALHQEVECWHVLCAAQCSHDVRHQPQI